jgi:hypothetical protein
MSAGHAAQNVRQDERGTEKGDSGAWYEWVRGRQKFCQYDRLFAQMTACYFFCFFFWPVFQ